MADSTKIEWCDSTMNPWIGCTRVSIEKTGGGGCDKCYAAVSTPARSMKIAWGAGQPRHRTSESTWKQPLRWNDQPFAECSCGWRGESRSAQVQPGTGLLLCPGCAVAGQLKSARRRVFCASLADVFDNEVDPQWRADLFRLIADTPNLDWLLLTKRIGNAARMIAEAQGDTPPISKWAAWPLPNVWLGATIVNQEEADRDIPKLLATPARVRFLSMEPLLGPVNLHEFIASDLVRVCPRCRWQGSGPRGSGCPNCRLDAEDGPLHWVIVGGESGHGARQFNVNWARSIVRQCEAAGVPVMVKQLGANVAPVKVEAGTVLERLFLKDRKGGDWTEWPEDLRVRQFPEAAHV